jgi:hypothetical protein
MTSKDGNGDRHPMNAFRASLRSFAGDRLAYEFQHRTRLATLIIAINTSLS